MGYEYEVNWASILQVIVFVSFAVIVYFTRKQTAKAAELESLKQDVNLLKEQIKHLPDSKQINQIEVDISAISQQMKGMKHTLDLLEAHLLNRNHK